MHVNGHYRSYLILQSYINEKLYRKWIESW
jgi:hypothetical protein